MTAADDVPAEMLTGAASARLRASAPWREAAGAAAGAGLGAAGAAAGAGLGAAGAAFGGVAAGLGADRTSRAAAANVTRIPAAPGSADSNTSTTARRLLDPVALQDQ